MADSKRRDRRAPRTNRATSTARSSSAWRRACACRGTSTRLVGQVNPAAGFERDATGCSARGVARAARCRRTACARFSAQIRAEARALEQPARVAYVGPEGGFCHQMAKAHFGCERRRLVEMPDGGRGARRGRARRAPYCAFSFESSADGLVPRRSPRWRRPSWCWSRSA